MARKRKAGDGTVRQRKDGRWEGRIVIGYDDNGYPKTKNVLAKTKKECVEKLQKLKEECGGLKPEKVRPEMPFGDWLTYWYENHSKPKIRPTTQETYESRIRLHIIPEIGDIPLNKLTQNDLQQFYGRLKKSGRKRFTDKYGEGLSDRMVRMCHATCRSALEKAVQEELRRFFIQAQAEGYYELFLLDLCTGLAEGRTAGPPVGRPGLQDRDPDREQAGLRGEGTAPGERPEDPRLHPQAGPAARRGGGAAAIPGDGGLPVDVPLTGQRGHPYDAGSGAPAAPDHSGAGRV